MIKLEIQNLTVQTEGKVVVNGVSFSVANGEVVVLMGANGSGKSSLVNAIMGHPKYEITGGEILLDGKDVRKMGVDERAKAGLFLSMQMVPEIAGVTFANFLHSAYKNLKDDDMEFSIMDFYKYLEAKADEISVDKSLLRRELNMGFSGGEKKQAELLQLVALAPKIAMLDEIDSGVDAVAMKKVLAGIEMLKESGTGFLLVTHNENLSKELKPDKVLVMEGGKIAKR